GRPLCDRRGRIDRDPDARSAVADARSGRRARPRRPLPAFEQQESTRMTSPTPELAALKPRQQAAWASGDYAVIGTTLQIVGEQLAEACDIGWDESVLEVAARHGKAAPAGAPPRGR